MGLRTIPHSSTHSKPRFQNPYCVYVSEIILSPYPVYVSVISTFKTLLGMGLRKVLRLVVADPKRQGVDNWGCYILRSG
jgi:hypothetical protein